MRLINVHRLEELPWIPLQIIIQVRRSYSFFLKCVESGFGLVTSLSRADLAFTKLNSLAALFSRFANFKMETLFKNEVFLHLK